MVSPACSGPSKAGFMAAVKYIAVRPPLLLMFLIALAMGAFGFNQGVTNPLMSTQVFGKGATEFGILGSVMGIGSLTSALLAARRPRPRIRQVVVGLGMFSVASCIAAMSPTFRSSCSSRSRSGWRRCRSW